MVEERSPQHQQEVSIDPEKLKLWENACLNYEDYQKLSVEDRSSMQKYYYVDIFARFSNGSGTWLCFSFLVFCFSDSFTSFTHKFVVTRACFYEHMSLLLLRARHEFFFLCIFIKFLISFLGHSNVELGVPSGMTKSAAESDKNLTTQIVAAKFKNNIGSVEVSGEKVWKSFDFF